MNYQPLSDRLLVRRIELGTKSASGIITADIDIEEKADTCFGKVIVAGIGKKLDAAERIPMDVKDNDYIVYNPRTPLKFYHGGQEYGILRESDVLMVVSGDDINELDPSDVSQFEARKAEMAPKARVIA